MLEEPSLVRVTTLCPGRAGGLLVFSGMTRGAAVVGCGRGGSCVPLVAEERVTLVGTSAGGKKGCMGKAK